MKSKKRLLVYTENYGYGGGNRYLIDTLNYIYKDFDEINIYSNTTAFSHNELSKLKFSFTHQIIPIKTLKIVLKSFGNLTTIRPLRIALKIIFSILIPIFFVHNSIKIISVLRKSKCKFVLGFNGGYPAATTTLLMMVLAHLFGRKTTMSIVSYPKKVGLFFFWHLFDRIIVRSIDTIIVNCKAIRNTLIKYRHFKKEKIKIIYNTVEDIPLPLKKENRNLIVGCIARMDYLKGIFYLIDAFKELLKHYPDIKLYLVGKGNASKNIESKIVSYQIESKVKVFGYYDGDINEILREFDVFVFPSLHEGFPYGILEAMRMGTAIVSTNVGGIPEAIVDKKDGLLVSPKSTDELIEAISIFIKDADLRDSMGKNARIKFVNQFKNSSQSDCLTTIFENA